MTPHAEAQRLLAAGFKLVELKPLQKRPVGNGWQLQPVRAIHPDAGGYGILLAANGLGSIDPDNVDRAREGLRRCGFDLDALMDAGVRTTSTRPGSGGRSTFQVPAGLGRIVFRSKQDGTLLELRAGQTNLQDCLPGTIYRAKDGSAHYRQDYANGRTFDDAPDLPPKFLAWWQRLDADLAFRREQEALFCGPGDARLSISTGQGDSSKLAYKSHARRTFNTKNDVPAILERHGYTTEDGERWAPPTATGAPCVRLILGRDGLWQSDHGSDPLLGTFDAWVAYVVLDHDGDQAAAEAAFEPQRHTAEAEDFDVVDVPARPQEAPQRGQEGPKTGAPLPVPLVWADMPEEPPEPQFVIPGWLPLNVVTLLAAHGGTGKSFLSLWIALCLATGRHPFIDGYSLQRVKVMLYSAEDDLAVMHWRLSRYMQILGIDPAALDGWLLVLDATESNNVLFVGDERRPEGRTTASFEWVQAQCAAFGATLLIFDNASDAYDGPENDRAKVRQFLSALKRVAPAVLLLSHVDAASSMADPGDAKGYSGSTAWHNSVRSRWFMARVKDSDDVALTLPKSNYGRSGSEVLIRWSQAERVFRVLSAREGRASAIDNRHLLLDLFRQVTDEMGETISPATNTAASTFNRIKDLEGFPRGLKTGDVAREVAAWRADGLVRVEQFTAANRKQAERLVLTDLGRSLLDNTGATAAGLC